MVKKKSIRHLIQALGALATNSNISGFIEGKIYTGNTKAMCVPVLNCYSCPGATMSCPIGSLQAVGGAPGFNLSHYVLGLLTLFGILGGRIFCGYLCPFGFFQDLLYKIKTKKIKHPSFAKVLQLSKYAILALLVFIMPAFLVNEYGIGDPFFCKYICPSGTLFAGLPLMITNPPLVDLIGGLFFWKLGLAMIIVILAVVLYRPFCRYICPLGAFYAIFNGISFYKFNINSNCINCGACERACGFDIPTYKDPNSPECIRCDECIRVCPTDAIEKRFCGKKLN